MVSIPKISPNLLLGVGGIIAVIFVVNQIRGAGKDLFGALPALDEGLRKSITDIQSSLGSFKFPSFTQPNVIPSDPTKQTDEQQKQIFGEVLTDKQIQDAKGDPIKQFQDTDNAFLKMFNPKGIFGFGFLGTNKGGISTQLAKQLGIFDFKSGDLSQQQITQLGIIGKGIPDLETVFKLFPRREDIIFARAFGLDVPREITPDTAINQQIQTQRIQKQQTPKEVISELPGDQIFSGGGVSFIGGTVRENPIDTLSEVIKFFPELSSSQAADFLAETGGKILPSQVDLIDPDIKNIVVTGGDFVTQERVDTSPQERLSIRKSENLKAAKFTCEQFGLNCELAGSMMA